MRRVSGEMTEQLRALAALTDDLGLISGTNVVAHTISNSRSGRVGALFWPVQELNTCGQAGMWAGTHKHKILKLKTIFKK